MNKTFLTICIILFVLVTGIVLISDTDNSHRVKFTNRGLEINNEGNEIVNEASRIVNHSSSVHNSDINTDNSGVNIEGSNTIFSSDDSFNNRDYGISHQNTDISSDNNINSQDTKYSDVDAAMAHIKRIELEQKQKNSEDDEYRYQNIDWNKWKSNFVNKILDDSVAIKELDNYQDGAWFYYSFIVDNEGRISNISIRSPYLKAADKQKVADLINSYKYKSITRFPQNSTRKTVRVNAVMLLSNSTTKHAKPKDFNDTEVVKYKVN